jgi:hypothetical protein
MAGVGGWFAWRFVDRLEHRGRDAEGPIGYYTHVQYCHRPVKRRRGVFAKVASQAMSQEAVRETKKFWER